MKKTRGIVARAGAVLAVGALLTAGAPAAGAGGIDQVVKADAAPGRAAAPRADASDGAVAGLAWDRSAKTITVEAERLTLVVDYHDGVTVTSLAVDGEETLQAGAATGSRIMLPDGTTVESGDALRAHAAPTLRRSGVRVTFAMPFAGGEASETWTFTPRADEISWRIDREYRLDDPTAHLHADTGVLVFDEALWQNVRRPADGGNIPVGGSRLIDAAAEFSAIDALGRNGISLETAPNHAVFDTTEFVFLSHERAAGLSVSATADGPTAGLLARHGTPDDAAGLESAWRTFDDAIEYANGNPAGYAGRFSEDPAHDLLAPDEVGDRERTTTEFRLSAVDRADYYDGFELTGVDSEVLAELVNDFGRTIVQGADIGASSERSFRAGEAPGFTSPWNVWSLELLQDAGAFASMRSQFLDIFAEPKRDPDDVNAPVGGRLGGLQDSDGRIHCCQPFGHLNEQQPTYATTDNTFNVVFSAATLYDLAPDEAWVRGIADDVHLALEYAESELLIRSGPTAGLFANAQCADPQSFTGCFTDWSEWNDQYDIGQVSAYHNVFAYGALTRWAELEREVLGNLERAEHYEELAAGVKSAYNRSTADGGFWSPTTRTFAYTRDATGAIAKDCSHLFPNGYALDFGLVDGARAATLATALDAQYDRLARDGHPYDHGAHGGTDYRWRLHGSNPVSCGSGETIENGWPRMYFPFFEDGGVHLLNEQPAAQFALELGDRAEAARVADQVVDRYALDGFMGWSNIQPDTLLPRRDIWQEPFMVNNVLGVWPLFHDVLGFQPHHDRLDLVPFIDGSMVGSTIDYQVHGVHPVSVAYVGRDAYEVTADGSIPVRIGWQRAPGGEYELVVDGSATTVTADERGMVWVDALNGVHRYEVAGDVGLLVDDAAFAFAGEWWSATGNEFLGGSLRGTSTTGATATLRFDGTGAAVVASTGGDKGLASITLDGQQLDPADWFEPAGATHLDRPVVVEGLEPGEHELVITVLGGRSEGSSGNQITIDGAVIFDGGPLPPDPDAPTETALHPRLFSYSDGWWGVADPAFLLGELRGTSQTGATVTISFTGTGVTLSGSTGGDKGQARIEIDGVDVGVADWFSTTPGHRVAVFEVDGLAPGPHTMTVTALGTANPGSSGTQINLDGVLARTG